MAMIIFLSSENFHKKPCHQDQTNMNWFSLPEVFSWASVIRVSFSLSFMHTGEKGTFQEEDQLLDSHRHHTGFLFSLCCRRDTFRCCILKTGSRDGEMWAEFQSAFSLPGWWGIKFIVKKLSHACSLTRSLRPHAVGNGLKYVVLFTLVAEHSSSCWWHIGHLSLRWNSREAFYSETAPQWTSGISVHCTTVTRKHLHSWDMRIIPCLYHLQ